MSAPTVGSSAHASAAVPIASPSIGLVGADECAGDGSGVATPMHTD